MKTCKILVCAATKMELLVLKEPLKQAAILHGHFDFVTTGIGNMETLHTLTQYTCKHGLPDLIINIGIAGHTNATIKKIPYQTLHITHLQTEKEQILASHLPDTPTLPCICSDIALTTPETIPTGHLVDMESFSVSWFAQKHHISNIILKIPYDHIGEETKHFSKQACQKFLDTIETYTLIEQIRTCIQSWHRTTVTMSQQ